MTNQSHQDSFIDPGPIEGHQDESLVTNPPVTETKYSMSEIVELSTFGLYWLGFFTNISIILVFFKEGLSTSTSISFFSLAFADLTVCVIYLTKYTSQVLMPVCSYCTSVYWDYHFSEKFEEAAVAISTWITLIVCWERLCCIAFPIKVKGIITRKLTTCLIVCYLPFQVTGATVYLAGHSMIVSISDDPASYNRYGITDCAEKNYYLVSTVMYLLSVSINIIPNVIAYILLLVGTILFLVIFKRSIQTRKSLTAKKKQSDSAKETRLMLSVLVVCVVYILTSGPRTIDRMIESIRLGEFYRSEGKIYLEMRIPSYAKYVFLVLQAINHCFNIFVYLAINSTFRKIFCKMFMLKTYSRTT